MFATAPGLPSRWDDDWYAAASAEQAHLLGADTIARHSGAWDPTFEAAMEHGFALDLEEYLAIRRRNIEARRVLDRLLTPGTLLVTPVLAGLGYTPAGCVEGSTTPGSPMGYAQTVLANITGHPAISMPAGLIGPGLPWGLQVMAGRWQDRSLLGLAHVWEAQHPWSSTAPGHAAFDLASLGV